MVRKLLLVFLLVYAGVSAYHDVVDYCACMQPAFTDEVAYENARQTKIEELVRYVRMVDTRLSSRHLQVLGVKVAQKPVSQHPDQACTVISLLVVDNNTAQTELISYELVDSLSPKTQTDGLLIPCRNFELQAGSSFPWTLASSSTER